MSVGTASATSTPARMWERLGNPLEWNDVHKILISHPTWLLVQDEIPCTPKGEITLKGMRDPVTVYEVAPRE